MKKALFSTFLGIVTVILLSAIFSEAAIITTGNVEPADPSTWTGGKTGTEASIGYTEDGSVTVNAGSVVTAKFAYLGRNPGVTGRVAVDGAGSTWDNYRDIVIGCQGTGLFDITHGGTASGRIYLAQVFGSIGTLTVDGAGSTLTADRDFHVGHSGTGLLNITNGGVVNNSAIANIGDQLSGIGFATVNGTGSMWANSSALNVGYYGAGMLSISNGGAVTASTVSVNNKSTLTADLGEGSSLTVGSGSGTITNNGTIRLAAGAGAASGTYTPMSYGTLSGNDAQALGGVWDAASHTVTVSDAATASAGEAKTIDLFATQRLLFTDSATGQRVGASFMAADTPTNLTFTASVMGESELSALEGILGSGGTVLSAWDFLAEGGYTEGDPVYLSFEIGDEYDLSALALWYYDGSTWSEYIANDLAYDNTYASFTVTDFSGYAVTASASVPIPAAVWLLGSGITGLGLIRRRRLAL